MKKQKWIVKFINKVDLPWGLSKEQLEELRKEAEQLTSENARLTDQLENSVQLPCKVGDTVYYIREAISKNPYEPKIEVGTVLRVIVTKSGLRLALSMNSVYENSTNSIGKSIFFDEQEANNALENLKQQAEARLKEL